MLQEYMDNVRDHIVIRPGPGSLGAALGDHVLPRTVSY